MGETDRRLHHLERRNQALMEKIKCLQRANVNLQQMNSKLRDENEAFKSTEEILLGNKDKLKKRIHQLKELQESLQNEIYVLEEQLCACTCRKDQREEKTE